MPVLAHTGVFMQRRSVAGGVLGKAPGSDGSIFFFSSKQVCRLRVMMIRPPPLTEREFALDWSLLLAMISLADGQ